MGELNQLLKEGKAYLNAFSDQKQNNLTITQLTAVLAQHQYDSAVVPVGIN